MNDSAKEFLRRFVSIVEEGGVKQVGEAFAYFKVMQMYKRERQGAERQIVWLALRTPYPQLQGGAQHEPEQALQRHQQHHRAEWGTSLTGTPPITSRRGSLRSSPGRRRNEGGLLEHRCICPS